VAYVILVFLVVYNSTRVFQAMPNRALRDASAAGLIFPPGVTGPMSGE
jgi:hypothetical protein